MCEESDEELDKERRRSGRYRLWREAEEQHLPEQNPRPAAWDEAHKSNVRASAKVVVGASVASSMRHGGSAILERCLIALYEESSELLPMLVKSCLKSLGRQRARPCRLEGRDDGWKVQREGVGCSRRWHRKTSCGEVVP